MPQFTYQGVDRAGKKVTGDFDSASEGDLRVALRGMGIRPTKISKKGALNTDLGSLLKGGSMTVNHMALVTFTRQLQVLIGAGIPLVQALEVLGEQISDRNLKVILSSVKEKVSGGAYFWEALNQYPKAFPKLYIALMRAGEASGSLDAMLKRLGRYLEDNERVTKMMKSAMMYPGIVVTIGVAIVGAMLTFVVPKFEEMLKGNNQELPMPTAVLIALSHFINDHFLYIIGTIGIVTFVSVKYLKSDEGRAVRDRVLFRAPIFGNILQKGGMARFSRTLQTLLNSGVNLLDGLDICRATIDNAVLEEAAAKIRAQVETGKQLGAVMSSMTVFPKMAVQMISIGESTGAVDKMLEKVADYYESDVEAAVSGLTKLIEPFIMVFLGGAIGGIMIAMYLPIFKMGG